MSRRSRHSRHQALRVWFSSIALMLSVQVAQAAGWPTTTFKAHVGNPFIGDKDFIDWVGLAPFEMEDFFGTPDDAVVAEIERAMNEAGRWYQAKGFPAPLMDMGTDDAGNPVYQFYLCTEDSGQKAWDAVWSKLGAPNIGLPWGQCREIAAVNSECGDDPDRNDYMYINYERAMGTDGKLFELSYQSIAHELVHAIEKNTPFGRSAQPCRINEWIGEGIADAISFDLAEDLWEGRRYSPPADDGSIIKRWGVRPYFMPLALPKGEVRMHVSGAQVLGAYGTSSFFRYLADSYKNGWQILYEPSGSGQPGLWQVGLVGPPKRDWKREVAWLNKGIKGKFGLDLAGMYGLFIASYSHRVPPFKATKSMTADQKLEYWVPRNFKDCPTVDISMLGYGTATLDIKKLASACLWVNPTKRPGSAQITFSAASDDKTFLESISIGRADTTLLKRAKVIDTPGLAQAYQTDWRDFPQDGSRRQLYLVSNVAEDPTKSRDGKLTLRAALPGYETSLTNSNLFPAKVAPSPNPPQAKRHAPPLAKQRAETRKMVNEQARMDKESLNDRTSGATSIERVERAMGCQQPFKYEACGAKTVITLEMRPGSYAQLGQTSADGGEAAQIFGSLVTVASSNPMESQQALLKYDERLNQVDGHKIKIEIPLIDYGDTGSFTPAEIEVQMSGNRVLRAVDETDSMGRSKINGQVTIEEFTPMFASGTFRGDLAELEEGPDGRMVYQSRQSIEGRFSSVSPYRNDPRFEKEQQSDLEMARDVGNALGIDGETVNNIINSGAIPGLSGDGSGGGSVGTGADSGGSSGECSCECEARALADDLCAFFCEEEFAACDGP